MWPAALVEELIHAGASMLDQKFVVIEEREEHARYRAVVVKNWPAFTIKKDLQSITPPLFSVKKWRHGHLLLIRQRRGFAILASIYIWPTKNALEKPLRMMRRRLHTLTGAMAEFVQLV